MSQSGTFNLPEATNNVIDMICTVLYKIVNHSQSIQQGNQGGIRLESTPFDLKVAPNVDLKSYLARIVYYSRVSISTLISTLALIDKFINKCKFTLTEKNLHMVVLTGLGISMKVSEDITLKDSDYAFLGMISHKMFVYNESIFLNAIEYRAFINEAEYNCYEKLFK